jgi:hypothetical protein
MPHLKSFSFELRIRDIQYADKFLSQAFGMHLHGDFGFYHTYTNDAGTRHRTDVEPSRCGY